MKKKIIYPAKLHLFNMALAKLKRSGTLLTFILFSFFARADYWTQKADFGGGPRAYNCGFSIGSNGYAGCGVDGSIFYNDFWEYNPSANTWTQKANMGGAVRSGATGFSIGSKGYIGTGGFADFWEWDQSTDVWTQKANFGGGAVQAAVGFSIGNKGYIGTGNGTLNNYFWEWDQMTNTWSQKANLPGAARWLAVGFSIGTKGYIGTGVGSNLLNDFWEWDQSTDTWLQKASLNIPRCEAMGFAIGAYGFICAGSIVWGSSDIDDLWQYNPVNDTWTQVANFGAGQRELGIGFSVGCKGYIGTGVINDANYHNDMWEYTPDSFVCITGIKELPTSNLEFTISPNPAKEFIDISYPLAGKENIEITITNAEGKKVYETKLLPSDFRLPVSNLQKGIYFVELSSGKQKAVKKFIKE